MERKNKLACFSMLPRDHLARFLSQVGLVSLSEVDFGHDRDWGSEIRLCGANQRETGLATRENRSTSPGKLGKRISLKGRTSSLQRGGMLSLYDNAAGGSGRWWRGGENEAKVILVWISLLVAA